MYNNYPYPPPPQQPQHTLTGIVCDACEVFIPEGGRIIEFYDAVVGVSQKSGLATVVENPLSREKPKRVHPQCYRAFTLKYLDEDIEDPQEVFCARCGDELEALCDTCAHAMEAEEER